MTSPDGLDCVHPGNKRSINRIITVAVAAHVVAAIFSIGYFHVDEHYQVLEFAGLKLGTTPAVDLPWEYEARLRPALQPGIAYVVVRGLIAFGCTNPFVQATYLRLLSVMLSLVCVTLLVRSVEDEITSPVLHRWLYHLAFLLWFVVYVHARFSSENLSGSLFFGGAALLYMTEKRADHTRLFVTGLIVGAAFVIRYQTGFMVVGLVLWLIILRGWRGANLAPLLSGMATAVLAGVVVDRWYYGEWTLTAWNYFDSNILQNVAARWGVTPWWSYFTDFTSHVMPPFSILFLAGVFLAFIWYPKHLWIWVSVPFLVGHIIVGHKELRFLFPLANIVPVLLILALQKCTDRHLLGLGKPVIPGAWKWLAGVFATTNAVFLLIVSLKPADATVRLYEYIYDHYRHDDAVLFCPGENPYHLVADPVDFYRSKRLTILKVTGPAEIADSVGSNRGKKWLLVVESSDVEEEYHAPGLRTVKVYQTIPEWLRALNYGDWMHRTRMWRLFELSPVESAL